MKLLAALILPVVVIVSLTVVGIKWLNVVGAKISLPTRVDTVRVETTLIRRATDTVRIVVKQVGPLTEQDLVRLICRDFSDGMENTNPFEFNGYGMVFCPKTASNQGAQP